MLGARQASDSFHCHPPHADCFLFTRNERGILDLLLPVRSEESPLLTAVRCLESQSQSGWFPYLWREAPAAGHTCALTAAPLVCMPGRENLVSSFNWTCHANGAVRLKGTAALTGAPHSRTARKILLLFHAPLDCLSGLCRPNWDKGNSNRLLYCWLSVNLPVKSLNGFSSPDRCAFLHTRLKLSHQLFVSLTAP